jgi:hypothetical protein
VRPARGADSSAILVVPNVKAKMEDLLSLHDLWRVCFTFYFFIFLEDKTIGKFKKRPNSSADRNDQNAHFLVNQE